MTILKSAVRTWGNDPGNKIQQVVTDEAVISTSFYGSVNSFIRSIYYGKIDAQKDHQFLYDPENSSVEIDGQARTSSLNGIDTCYQPVDSITSYPKGEEICWPELYESGTFYRITSPENRPGTDEDIYMKSWKKISDFSLEEYPIGIGYFREIDNIERNITNDRSILEEDPLKKYYPENWWEDPWGLASSLKIIQPMR